MCVYLWLALNFLKLMEIIVLNKYTLNLFLKDLNFKQIFFLNLYAEYFKLILENVFIP